MDRPKRVVKAFLNSAEGYFHKKRILEDRMKDPEFRCSPNLVAGPKEKYTNVRDLTKNDFECIIAYSCNNLDWDLYKINPFTALNAALQTAIYHMFSGKYQSKIDARTYEMLLNIFKLKVKEKEESDGSL